MEQPTSKRAREENEEAVEGEERASVASDVVLEGAYVVLYGGSEAINPVQVVRGGSVQGQYGEFLFDELIGHPYGQRFYSSKGLTGFVYPLRATPELLTSGGLEHRTQLVHSSDVAYITHAMGLRAGHTVLEAGTGSGSLTNALARITGPSGRVFTFEFHAERAQQARELFAMLNTGSPIIVTHRDVCTDGFGAPELEPESADGLFLDVPSPWTALDHVQAALRPGCVVCCYSPCLEQVARTCSALSERRFDSLRTVEVRQRPWDASLLSREAWTAPPDPSAAPTSLKRRPRLRVEDPDTVLMLKPHTGETAGHTAFLTFATKQLPPLDAVQE